MNYAGSIAAPNASQQAATNRQDRSQIILQNLSATDMFFNFGEPAVVGQGIRVIPNERVTLNSGRMPQIRSKVNVISAMGGGGYALVDDAVDIP